MPEIDLGKVVGPQGIQGIQGIPGPPGDPANINGVNTLTLTPGPNVTLKQDGSSMEIGAVVPGMNLLDNGYFLYPVNQRNIASGELWGGYVYGIDRWRSFGADVTKWVYGEGIYLTNGQNSIIEQHMEASVLPDGAVLMLSALANNQIIDMTFVVSSKNVNKVIIVDDETMELQFLVNYPADKIYTARIWHRYRDGGNAVKVTAAKLELGTVQTLAHKEGDTWVLNDPPSDKTLELLKCQKYYVNSQQTIQSVKSPSINQLMTNVVFPVKMRARPTVKIRSHINTPGILGDFNSGLDTEIAVSVNDAYLSPEGFNSLTVSGTLSAAASYVFKYEASADL